MHHDEVDRLLAGSAPQYEPSLTTRAALDAVIAEARTAAGTGRRSRRRQLMWLVPGALVAAGVLTAGGLAVDDLLRTDLPIVVEYTTDAGDTVSCTAEIRGGSLFSPHRDEVIEYYETHDFSGVGQQIYDYAMVLTGDREPEPGLLPESSEWVPDEGQFYADADAFSLSLTSFLLTDTLVELGISGGGDTSLESDCTGQLR